ncbi:anacyclamide/piricyclamide family prenylated cyclic peptide [Roseofilum casamattae]|uniref:Anacyclamide/piricyclamide family prenylated cyclic peptide n=1 Tax=Roseofilum casamattae BLCC-M143 TaxID=3022442 RepID=A0ABT7C471_9CYAN|nr:anacyclamide/piricyclamide family prenylated cyclic peptide [Roseofilum casamattae]MDJ1185616.1 anacyclamide/piricyclamide family prenylated cyclic peptide [Roseofilum casamattae BLCC-M143]
MKTKKLTPVTVAPVKRENVAMATVSRDGNAMIAPALSHHIATMWGTPFAGDEAE